MVLLKTEMNFGSLKKTQSELCLTDEDQDKDCYKVVV